MVDTFDWGSAIEEVRGTSWTQERLNTSLEELALSSTGQGFEGLRGTPDAIEELVRIMVKHMLGEELAFDIERRNEGDALRPVGPNVASSRSFGFPNNVRFPLFNVQMILEETEDGVKALVDLVINEKRG